MHTSKKDVQKYAFFEVKEVNEVIASLGVKDECHAVVKQSPCCCQSIVVNFFNFDNFVNF